MRYFASSALLPDGWADNVVLDVDEGGTLRGVALGQDCPADAERLGGFVVPGLANVHSHAFQRAMAGLTEFRGHSQDSFWTWRDLMYRYASRITPMQMGDVARWLYIEMLKAGYTGVAEFHYLHHDVGGVPYAPAGEMSHCLLRAAEDTGIAITLLPVLYAYSGFGGRPATDGQRRFLHDLDGYAVLLADLHTQLRGTSRARLGMAFHSLRAVDATQIAGGLQALNALDPQAPVHIHIAEQTAEVQDCVRWSGLRPVQWLFAHAPVDARWCLVHATHLDDAEIGQIAASGAVVAICPSTEANLGDGFFPARPYLDAPGPSNWAIGSDSHITVDAADELRLLEYGQRLLYRQRAVLASATCPSVGRSLYTGAAIGGGQALGRDCGRLVVGAQADWVVLDPVHPALAGRRGDAVLDSWIFVGQRACVRDVMVGGQWQVREGRHTQEEQAYQAFRRVIDSLRANSG